jgi:5-methylcytosine-specific restriction protein A
MSYIMPSKPLKPCKHIGCINLSVDTYCYEHQQSKPSYDMNRPNATRRGYDARWRKVRKLALLRDKGTCQHCLRHGEYTPATEVDHIIAIVDGGSRLDLNNLQSLCKPCHSRKTVLENGGFGK